jgi:hypothetical protein
MAVGAPKISKKSEKNCKKKEYRERYKEMSGRDPLICSYCGHDLELWKIWHPKYGNIYDEYENLKSGKYGTVQEEDIGGRGHTVRPATNGIQLPLFQVDEGIDTEEFMPVLGCPNCNREAMVYAGD